MKKIIFIESSDVGAKYTAEGCRQLGYQPLFFCDLKKVQADTRDQLEAELKNGNLIQADTTSVESLLSALSVNGIDRSQIAGVMTFLDSRLEMAADLASRLHSPLRADKSIPHLKSKANVQTLIPQWSPPHLTFECDNPPMKILAEFIRTNHKVIVKPTKTAGAIGAKIFTNENLHELKKYLVDQKIPTHLSDQSWVCQKFLTGPLFSIEGYVFRGEIHFLGVSDRTKIGFTESRLEFPVEKTGYQQAVADLIAAAGFQNGYFHIEYIEQDGRSYIIDANMGRLGGGPLGQQIPLAFNMPIADFYAHVIERTIIPNSSEFEDLFTQYREAGKTNSTIGICYGSPVTGYFDSLSAQSNHNFLHTLILDPMQTIDAMGANNWTWVGIIAALKADFSSDIQKVKLKINGEQVPLCY